MSTSMHHDKFHSKYGSEANYKEATSSGVSHNIYYVGLLSHGLAGDQHKTEIYIQKFLNTKASDTGTLLAHYQM